MIFTSRGHDLKLKKIRADAICHLSGGIDSKTASALFAKNNPRKKIVLITYKSIMEAHNDRSRKTAKELIDKYNNITAHFLIKIPKNTIGYVFSTALYSGNRKDDTLLDPCGLCSYLWLTSSIYLHKKIFKGKFIIEGMRLAGLNFKKEYVEERTTFAKQYGILTLYPVLSFEKKEKIFILARKLGLKEEGHQGVCVFKKSPLASVFEILRNTAAKKTNPRHNRSNDRVRLFINLLKKNGIASDFH